MLIFASILGYLLVGYLTAMVTWIRAYTYDRFFDNPEPTFMGVLWPISIPLAIFISGVSKFAPLHKNIETNLRKILIK
jgi:hypothetical protein